MILASIFRNSGRYVDRYVNQVKALRDHADVTVIVGEGDSVDNTYDRLLDTDFTVLKVEHGGPSFRSRDNVLRWRHLAAVCNVVWAAAVREHGDEPVVWVESDIIWDASTIVALVHDLRTVPAVAAMSYRYEDPSEFYDIWGHVKDGTPFTRYPPYHAEISHQNLCEIDSAGSCFAIRADAVSAVEFAAADCVRGVGRSLRAAGFSLWLDPQLAVSHP
jgi:hypothetical protein